MNGLWAPNISLNICIVYDISSEVIKKISLHHGSSTPYPVLCENCKYTTPEGTPNWEMMFSLLNIHSQAGHGVAVHQAAAPVLATSRLEKLPRPTLSLNSSDATWNFTKTLWDAYIGQTAATDSVMLQQLQAACDKALLQRVFDTGMYATLNTVEIFLEKMRELAVVTAHMRPSVHMWPGSPPPRTCVA